MTTVTLLAGLSAAGLAAAMSDRRLIVAYGAAGSDPMIRLEALVESRRCQLLDRQVDVYLVSASEIDSLESSDSASSSESLVASLVAYRGAGDFELLLVGKDRGVKARSSDPQALDRFLEAIDGMPMRRSEMRQRGGADVECDSASER